jgi:hypothetical protein
MTTHPYIRAYLAGIAVPNLVLLVVVTAYSVARYALGVPIPVERVIVFPMAIVPNLFGVWNVLYLSLRSHPHLSIGIHGALLPFILAPLGFVLATCLGFLSPAAGGFVWFGAVTVPYAYVGTGFSVAVIVYYLVWKHLVGFLNEMLGIA